MHVVHFDGLVQERRNSIADGVQLRLGFIGRNVPVPMKDYKGFG